MVHSRLTQAAGFRPSGSSGTAEAICGGFEAKTIRRSGNDAKSGGGAAELIASGLND